MSGEAVLSAENSGKPLARTPLEELTALLQTPSWWKVGLQPLHKTPTPRSRHSSSIFGLSVLPPPKKKKKKREKNPGHALDAVVKEM